jgi:methylthioribose-1-phosphate isomerase
MKIDGKQMRTIWVESDGAGAGIIDQTSLPHRFATVRLSTLEDAARAIKTMQVRGAPLIGAAAAYGVPCVRMHPMRRWSGLIPRSLRPDQRRLI